MIEFRVRAIASWAAAMPCLLLAACGNPEAELAVQPDDPIMSRALGENMMIDPDLTGQNQANAAISDGSRDGSLPPLNATKEAIAAARSEAIEQVGSLAEMRSVGEPSEAGDDAKRPRPITMVARMESSGIIRAECTDKASYTAAWAARMPDVLPVYPRGAVQSAAGISDDGCNARAVNFRTPVSGADVLDFYFTKAAKAGFDTEFRQSGAEQVLHGAKGDTSFAIYVSAASVGIVEVDLVTSGS